MFRRRFFIKIMWEKQFSEAFNAPPCRVLGLQLRTYAIGHELALTRQGNPVATSTESAFAELSDAAQRLSLASAVEICCERTPRFNLLWALRSIRLDFTTELKKFREYRESGSKEFPTTKQPRVHGVPYHYFGAPELAGLINYVSAHHRAMIDAHFGGSPLNFPLGLARMLCQSHLESEGAIWIENFQDAELKAKRDAYDRTNHDPGIAVGEEAVKKAAQEWNKAHPESPVSE